MLSSVTGTRTAGSHENFSTQLEARGFQTWAKDRSDSRWFQFADDLSILTDPCLLKLEYVGHNDGFAFHTNNFSNRRHFARAIFEARLLNNEIYRR